MIIRWSYILTLVILFNGMQELFASTTDSSVINRLNESSLGLINSHPDSAKKLALQAIVLSEKSNYLRGLGDAYTRLGVLAKNTGNLDSAILFHKKSLMYRKQYGTQEEIGKCYINICLTYNRKGDPDSALFYGLTALRIFEQSKDSFNLNLCVNNLGLVYKKMRNFSEAEKYFRRSLLFSETRKDTPGIQRALSNLGGKYVDMKNFDEAYPYLRRAIELAKKLNNAKELAILYNNLAVVYHQSYQKPDSALIFYILSARTDSSLHDNGNLAVKFSNIGELYYAQQQFKNAIYYLEKSIQLSKDAGNKKLTATAYQNLALAHKDAGDPNAAFDDLWNFQLYNDSVYNEAKATAFTEMQTKYETEKKEQQITLLGEQNKVQRLQKNIFLAGVIALIALAVGLFIFFSQKQLLAKHSDQIQKQQIGELLNTQEIKSLNAMMDGQEKERKRIAADLHDRIGSSLAAIKLHFNGMAKGNGAPSENKEQFTRVNTMFDNVVNEVRQVSHDLASGVLMKFGVVSALRDLSDSIESTGDMKVHFFHHGMDERLDHRTEISIYRISQELISNILKHAQAQEINIHLNRQNGNISLMVEDDGIGFEPKKVSGGIGMKNIRSRVTHMHGTLFFDSSPGKGCTVTVEMPLSSRHDTHNH